MCFYLLLLLLQSLLIVGNQISFGTPPSTDDQAHVTDIISPHFSLFFFVELNARKGSSGVAAVVVSSSGSCYQMGRKK
uniref:Secreted protein n=1 Tax=Nelumbo nucifera TaxID=4432 RepID=A0A822YLZ4_NELNU|nr:TPA_asm: hypothetical protein HUJ06_011180 [Nelumbo nucifera]